MTEHKRPSLEIRRDTEPVDTFVRQLQDAIDSGDADLFNAHFADDVLWGSPFGAVAAGFDQIHAIHSRMFASVAPVKGAAQYSVEHARFVAENVAVAYIRRIAAHSASTANSIKPGAFDELALIVLVQRDGQWWLAAAQHVPDRRDVYSQTA